MAENFLNEWSKNSILKRNILRICIKNGLNSISDISKELNLSVPTATKLISELVESDYLKDEGKLGTVGGRRPTVFGLNPMAGFFVGVDIGRHHFHLAVSDFKGNLVYSIEEIEYVLAANEESMRKICELIKLQVTQKALVDWSRVVAVGISLAGRVNPELGYSLTYSATDNFPIGDFFCKEFGVPVTIENDSRAMTYGEYMSFEKDIPNDMLLINLSWGLGMGMILNGSLYYGKSGYSGEIGHFPLLDNGLICRCGKVGCLETGASGSALKRMIVDRLRAGEKSSLESIFREKGDVRFEDILSALREEDMLVIDAVGHIGEILGRGISGLINVFNPGLVIIGGRLVDGKEYLLLPIKTAVNKYSLQRVSSDTRITLSKLGRKAAVIGNCMLARKKLLGI